MSIKPATPKGTRDFSSDEIAKRNYLKTVLQQAFEKFGFQPIETPSFERLETLTGVYGEEGDRLVFKILNSGEKVKKADFDALQNEEYQKFSRSLSEKALRYDLTVPFARYVAQHQNDLAFPFRRYQIQPVWRADRPQHGRFQEFYQCDADIVGDRSLWQEIEMISLYDYAFNELHIEGIVLKINHRKILMGIAGVLGAEEQLTAFTIALDKLDKIDSQGVLEELKTKGFSNSSLSHLESLLTLKGSATEQLAALKSILKSEPEGLKGIEELEFVLAQLEGIQLKSVSLAFDLTLARGLHYYTGLIVEVKPPESVVMGSIGGGGRYDDLTGSFGLKNMSGIGISFGFERIYFVLDELGLFPKTLHHTSSVLFANFGDFAAKKAFQLLSELRRNGISGEMYPTAAKLKKQLSYADSKQIAKVILIGSEELEQNQFVVKDMVSGEQTTHPIASLIQLLT
ncbi:MAG: histidine--tRNA ligase [Bacteroidetes bacterium]|nr:histidine--tRNA ligase [Bacteroidota bacterium]MDA0922127.1 histidine--tRNA ligase [Bacteroidota bacterium]MDA1287970.1 histidine--tRNA ligase [Bacteroidota bacterium]